MTGRPATNPAVTGRPVRVGVVGLGTMGRTHLAVLRSLGGGTAVDVIAVADVRDDLVGRAVRSHAVEGTAPQGFTDALELVTTSEVDAVVIASPDSTHAELVHACLDRGLPVLCEKPLTTSSEDSAAVVEHERSTGRRLVQAGFMRRYDPAFAAVVDAVHRGDVGAPAVVRTVHRNPVSAYAFEPSVLVTNSASHDVDLLLWVTGDDVVEVACETAPDPTGEFAAVLLRTRTRTGVLTVTELAYGPGCGYEVGLEVMGRSGVARTPIGDTDGDWTHRFDEAYRRQLVAWVDSVATGRPDPRAAEALDGLVVNQVLDAADRAWRTGQPQQPARVPS